MVAVHRPETRCEVDAGDGRTIISQVGDHYLLDVKGPASRFSQRIHMLLGNEEQVLTSELIWKLSQSFSERQAGVREQFERFLSEHVGWTISSGYFGYERGPTTRVEPLHVA
jgi:hypothetical protein